MERNQDFEILIVDDNTDNLHVIRNILKNYYKIRIATNGIEALDSINLSLPDLILLDVHLPKLSGFEVCIRLKESKETEDIPIIFLSALQDHYNKLQAFKLGAVDYITKPYEIEEVLARVKIHLKLCGYKHEMLDLKRQLKLKEEHIEKLKKQNMKK